MRRLRYQRIGDPNTLRLHNGERVTVGLDINDSNWGGGALFDYEKSLFPGVPDSFTVDPYVTVPFLFGAGLQIDASKANRVQDRDDN